MKHGFFKRKSSSSSSSSSSSKNLADNAAKRARLKASMTQTQVIFEETFAWYFYAFLVMFVGIVGWLGYRAAQAVWVLSKFGSFRKSAQKTEIPTGTITFMVWLNSIGRIGFFVFVAYGTWIIIQANFCMFRQLDISHASIRLTYNYSGLNRELPIISVRSIDLTRTTREKFTLDIEVSDGKIYHSMTTEDQAAISDCRRLIAEFQGGRSPKK